MEVLENSVLTHGNNTISFQRNLIVGGPIYLSDVVLWFGADTFLTFNSTDGVERIRLNANLADLRMGGNGAGGDVVLFPASGSIGSLSQATIRLDANGGNAILGGSGTSGDLMLLPPNVGLGGPATITLTGATGAVSAGSFIAGGITLNVPDYVWDSTYALMPLAELQTYVAREKRLPNVPGAEEIKRDGLNLSQFQMRLLEKIEELTRYLLGQEETIQIQQAQIDALGDQVKQLGERQRDLSRSRIQTCKIDGESL